MQRLLLIASMAGLLFTTTGCLHRNVRSGSCPSCNQGHGGGQKPGLLNKLGGGRRGQPVAHGCQPGPLGWQQGGTNYPTAVNTGWGARPQRPATAGQRPATAGPQGGTVGYPYYTTRGPRDFLLDNPPSIGR